jgi:hypothetical protein
VQVRQRTTDGTTSAALNFGGFRQVRQVDDLDRQAATFFTNDLERRAFAGGVLASGGARWAMDGISWPDRDRDDRRPMANGWSREVRRKAGLSENNRAVLSGGSPELKLERAAATGLIANEVSWRTYNVRQGSGAKEIRTEVPWLEISVIFFS